MTRIIECQVSNEYVKGAGVVAGAAGNKGVETAAVVEQYRLSAAFYIFN